MSILRSAVAGPSRRLAHTVASIDAAAPSTSAFPPVIARYVKRHLARDPSTSSVPNPFVVHRSSTSSEPDAPASYTPRYISRRREKTMRYWYGSPALPPSPSPSTEGPAAVSFTAARPDGTTASLSWSGEVAAPATGARKSLYDGRRVMFKGHKHERERPERRRETEERMTGMDKRIAEWKRNKQEARQSAKPSLPF